MTLKSMKQNSKLLKLSGLEQHMNNLDLDLETFVGTDGIKLSGGQVQRIGIARAIYLQQKCIYFR